MDRHQLVIALECCANNAGYCNDFCPLRHDDECTNHLAQAALVLIRDLDAEKERYKADLAKEFTCIFGTPHKVVDCPITAEVAKAKIEAVMEFAERLLDTKSKICNDYYIFADNVKVILSKMLTEGGEP